jgi:hypothetical protein
MYLETIGIRSLGVLKSMVDELPHMKEVIDALAAEIRAGRREGSVMTDYSNDEMEVWRQFRRELIGEGFSSHSIRKHSTQLKNYLKFLSDEGLLQENLEMGFAVSHDE